MEKKLCDIKGDKGYFLLLGVLSFDGMYSVVNQSIVEKEYDLDQCFFNIFCDDMLLVEKRRGKRFVTFRFYKFFRERYFVKGRFNKFYFDNSDRYNNNSILEVFFFVGFIREKIRFFNRIVYFVLEIFKVTFVLKSSFFLGSINFVIFFVFFGYYFISFFIRVFWQSYQYEKMCYELIEKLYVESQVQFYRFIRDLFFFIYCVF